MTNTGDARDDAQTLAHYRRVLEQAARELARRGDGASVSGMQVASATGALFAALARRDERERAMLAVVRAVADGRVFSENPGAAILLPEHSAQWVERARQLVAAEGGES